MRKQTRSEAREKAFAAIFQLSFDTDVDSILEYMVDEDSKCLDNLAYIKQVVYGVSEKNDELKEIISSCIKGERGYNRLSNVVKAILLLAVYEINYVEDVPEKVAVDEAVELAKKYAEEEAPAFINGVLAGVISK